MLNPHPQLGSARVLRGCGSGLVAAALLVLVTALGLPAQPHVTPRISSSSYSGANHSLALLPDGHVRAWGNGLHGQLGLGNTFSASTPTVSTTVPGVTNARDIAAGYRFSLALLADGTVKSWGYNNVKQLGLGAGSPTQVTSPTAIPGLSGVIAIAAGTDFALALRADGTVKGWGSNHYGQTGVNSSSAAVSVPTTVVTSVGTGALTGVIAIAAGGAHALALRSDGTVFAWGTDFFGELGSPGSVGGSFPVAFQMPTVSGAVAIAAGASHSLIVLANGTVLACGDDTFGQLGIASGQSVNQVPTIVLHYTGAPLVGITRAAGGRSHSLFLNSAGDVLGCGNNSGWKLGLEVEQVYSLARFIPDGLGAVSIAASSNCSFIITANGQAYACGTGQTLGIASGVTVATTLTLMPQLTGISCGNIYNFGLAGVGDGLQMQIACNQGTNVANLTFGELLFYVNAYSFDALNGGSQVGGGNWFGLFITPAELDLHLGLALSGFNMVIGMLGTGGGATAHMPLSPALTGLSIYGVSVAINPLSGNTVAESNIAGAVL